MSLRTALAVMHYRSLSAELQGPSALRPPLDGASSWSSRTRTESALRSPLTGACFWVCLLLGALLVPGAWSALSEEEEELLVELHNFYRGRVSPSASAMLPLKWDPNLKVLAEGYAAKCIWNHNGDLDEEGENLFVSTGPLDLRDALEKWFLEHVHFSYQNNSCEEDMMCGHYTQMVWADTHRVGCAVHSCNTMENLDWERVSFLVCNYFPGGNYDKELPYIEGDWCSSCPENLQKCENNLCVPDVVEEEEASVRTADPSSQAGPGPTQAGPGPTEAGPGPTSEPIVEIPEASSPRAPSIIIGVPMDIAEDTPPPGTAEDDFLLTDVPSSNSRQQEEEVVEKQREKRVLIVKGGIREKSSYAAKTLSSAASVSTASVLLSRLAGLLTLWLLFF